MEPGITGDDILRAIQGAMKELFDLDATRVQPSARLVEDLGLDSVEALDLLAKMEEMTGQAFAETKLRKLRTVGDVVAAIQAVASGSARADRLPA